MPSGTILIIEDEPQIRRALRSALVDEVGRILEAQTGSEGISVAASTRPDLVILDLGLPDVEGVAVCREIRQWSMMPIVVLTARHSEHEKVLLLDTGADDFVTKPFSPAEVRARVRAHLRRARATTQQAIATAAEFEELSVDFDTRTVRRSGELVRLTPTEWELLRTFIAQAGRTLTHRQIFAAVWGRSTGDPQAYLRVHIANLRRKIEVDPVQPRFIITEAGVGYRFEPTP